MMTRGYRRDARVGYSSAQGHHACADRPSTDRIAIALPSVETAGYGLRLTALRIQLRCLSRRTRNSTGSAWSVATMWGRAVLWRKRHKHP